MPFAITDGTVVKQLYEPPPPPLRPPPESMIADLARAMTQGFREALAKMPAPVVNVEAPVINVPKPEVKINSPVYVTAPEVRVPPTTVNVPDGKAPVVNIEPASVTLQTNRPNKWKFTFNRDELGRITTVDAEAK